jgi:hypothetical protein
MTLGLLADKRAGPRDFHRSVSFIAALVPAFILPVFPPRFVFEN